MKRFVTALLITTGVIQLSAAELVWNNEAAFRNWKAEKNVRMTIENNMIKLSDIAFDHHIMIPNLNLDATLYNRISITYRATPSESKPGQKFYGQIFYTHTGTSMNSRMFWRISPLQRDGKWHTVVLKPSDLFNQKSWFKGGPITALRLDITDAPGGTIEIKELKFYFQK